jgi:DNA replication protein DnaC
MAASNDVLVRLQKCFRYLQLPGIRDGYEEITAAATREGMALDRYLLALLERESDVRWNHRVERLMRGSRLPPEKTLERFEMKRLPAKAAHQVKALLDGGFLERRENVLLFGNPGSGKTHLVCALGHALVRQGRRVSFTTCGLLVQELLLAKRNLHLPRMLKKLAKYEALIIDDIGYVHQGREEMDVLFMLLAERYERGSVLITSNLPFSKWDTIFKDPMVTAAAIDRLVHHSVILELNIGSYRMSAAKKTAAEART